LKEIIEKAYAKINIGLKIISKRPDGYHDLETIFQQIDLCDTIKLSIRKSNDIVIKSDNKNIPLDENNICHKAALLFRAASGLDFGLTIHIQKEIPTGAGLGGGSSNAAAVLLGLEKLMAYKLPEKRLNRIARDLGADVPFFLVGGTAYAEGIGDKIKTVRPFPDFFAVLVYPNIEISSAWAYKNFNFNLTKTKKIIKLSRIIQNRICFSDLKDYVENDFEKIVFAKYPELLKIKELLYRKGAFLAMMSGSGSTIFGLFTGSEKAEAARKYFSEKYKCFLTQPKK